jgi:transcription elongation factor GreA
MDQTGQVEKSINGKSLIDTLKDILAKEVWSRNDISILTIAKFKELDQLLKNFQAKDSIEEARSVSVSHLESHNDSNISKYLIGIIGLITKRPEDTTYLRMIMDQFRKLNKWQLLVHTADRMLDYGDNRFALRAIVEGMDQGSYPKSKIKPYYEKLAKIDRKNPEIAEKYGRSLIDEGDKKNGLKFIKQAAEAYARTNNPEKLTHCWRYLVDQDPDDLSFFEKIERILVNNRENIKAAELIMHLVDYTTSIIPMANEDEVQSLQQTKIDLLKKVLEHNPHYHKARVDIINTYKKIYANHSLLKEFIQHSELNNNRKDVLFAIAEFEKNIVFDKGNYVAHKSWGVGKINDLNQNEITIDFKNKKDHVMSIQMALKSLKPLEKSHIWVQYYENEEKIKNLFKEQPIEFFIEMLKSFGSVIQMADIKNEVIGTYIPQKEWSKWWSKLKLQLKKHPNIGFSPRKKTEIFFREEKITLSEELTEKFIANKDYNKKLDLAMEALEDIQESQEAIDHFIAYYNQEEKSKIPINRIIAYFYLKTVSDKTGEEEIFQHLNWEKIKKLIKALSSEDLVVISSEIKNLEIKKTYITAIKNTREDYDEIFGDILFEVPIKIHKFIFNELIKESNFETLNNFVKKALKKLKDAPEVFLWVARNILNNQWDYDWLKVQFQDVVLRVFRLLRPLGKIEKTGTKLKKMAQDIIFGNNAGIIRKTIEVSDDSTIRKMAALFKEVPYIEDAQKMKLMELIHQLKPSFKTFDDDVRLASDADMLKKIPGDDVIIVTQESLRKKEKEYDYLVNVEMVENSKDIGKAQKLGDLRENAEYKAALEKQQQLQSTMTKMDADFKKIKLINPDDIQTDSVCIGSRLLLKNKTSSEKQYYTILGPWDADTEKRIISYKSPLAQALIGKNIKDSCTYQGSPDTYEILEIEKAL